MASKIKYAKGERLNIHFNSKIKLEFHGVRLLCLARHSQIRNRWTDISNSRISRKKLLKSNKVALF